MAASASPRLRVCEPDEAARELGREIAELVRRRAAEGRGCALGLAAGASPRALYAELARLRREEGLELAGVATFQLDEFLGLAPGDPRSFRAFLECELVRRVDLDLALFHSPRGDLGPGGADAGELARRCADYEEQIRAAGGIDLQLLGLGRNGHVAFNEPGSDPASRTRVVALDPATREDQAVAFGGIEFVPKNAITMGIATILEARRLRVLAFGARKSAALARLLEGPVGADCPASLLRAHPDCAIYADRAALGR